VDDVALAARPRVVVFLEMGTRKSCRPESVDLGLAVLLERLAAELEFMTIWSNRLIRVDKAELDAPYYMDAATRGWRGHVARGHLQLRRGFEASVDGPEF
jgi:hypothetical protein